MDDSKLFQLDDALKKVVFFFSNLFYGHLLRTSRFIDRFGLSLCDAQLGLHTLNLKCQSAAVRGPVSCTAGCCVSTRPCSLMFYKQSVLSFDDDAV